MDPSFFRSKFQLNARQIINTHHRRVSGDSGYLSDKTESAQRQITEYFKPITSRDHDNDSADSGYSLFHTRFRLNLHQIINTHRRRTSSDSSYASNSSQATQNPITEYFKPVATRDCRNDSDDSGYSSGKKQRLITRYFSTLTTLDPADFTFDEKPPPDLKQLRGPRTEDTQLFTNSLANAATKKDARKMDAEPFTARASWNDDNVIGLYKHMIADSFNRRGSWSPAKDFTEFEKTTGINLLLFACQILQENLVNNGATVQIYQRAGGSFNAVFLFTVTSQNQSLRFVLRFPNSRWKGGEHDAAQIKSYKATAKLVREKGVLRPLCLEVDPTGCRVGHPYYLDQVLEGSQIGGWTMGGLPWGGIWGHGEIITPKLAATRQSIAQQMAAQMVKMDSLWQYTSGMYIEENGKTIVVPQTGYQNRSGVFVRFETDATGHRQTKPLEMIKSSIEHRQKTFEDWTDRTMPNYKSNTTLGQCGLHKLASMILDKINANTAARIKLYPENRGRERFYLGHTDLDLQNVHAIIDKFFLPNLTGSIDWCDAGLLPEDMANMALPKWYNSPYSHASHGFETNLPAPQMRQQMRDLRKQYADALAQLLGDEIGDHDLARARVDLATRGSHVVAHWEAAMEQGDIHWMWNLASLLLADIDDVDGSWRTGHEAGPYFDNESLATMMEYLGHYERIPDDIKAERLVLEDIEGDGQYQGVLFVYDRILNGIERVMSGK
jgi:hypothetical protein